MRILLSWLREYIDLPENAEEIARMMTRAGIEVDRIENREPGSDTVFEVSLTPNLGHCLSIMGIARELGAFLGRPLKKRPWLDAGNLAPTGQSSQLRVTVQESALCPRYSALLLEGVAVGPSPLELRLRLESCGIRSVNNVVDVTNLVMLELGQPLHAFDADKVEAGHLIVRAATKGETLLFLDGQSRTLPEGCCVIADSKKVLAVAGVMGGLESAVSDSTTRVILESAFFPPAVVRKGGRKLFVHTESSKRFERGTDAGITVRALKEAHNWIKPTAHLKASCDVGGVGESKKISCRLSRASSLLGYEVSTSEMESAFTNLGLAPSFDGQDTFTITVPSFRHDLQEEVDLIEEVGRLVGLQQNKELAPKYSASKLAHNPLYLFQKEVRKRLLAEGLQEVITCDLISEEMASIVLNHPITSGSLVKVLNPLSVEQSILRPSLLPGMLDVLHRNINQRTLDFAAFEVGHVHLKKEATYQEPLIFGILLSGKRAPHHFSGTTTEFDFFDIKGILENLFKTLGLNNLSVKKSELSILHPGRQAKIYLSNVHVGMVGELHPALLRKLGIDSRAFFAECDIQELWQLPRLERTMQALALYPSSERDWTVTVSKKAKYDEILAQIKSAGPSILERIELLATYESEKLGHDLQNITFRFVYRDRDKTVSQEEVEQAHLELVSHVSRYLAQNFAQNQLNA